LTRDAPTGWWEARSVVAEQGVMLVTSREPASEDPAMHATGLEEDERATDRAPVQAAFPSLWRYVRPTNEHQFSHIAEHDFAAILTFYRVRWSYEPTTFPLEWADDGRPRELFTPDFYLPDLRLYVELTTMRQRLVTRKNRKLRRLRELYPDIQIKLLYRRDYYRFVELYVNTGSPSSRFRPGAVLVTSDEIAARVDALASEIAASDLVEADGVPLLAVVASPGADRFATLLGAALMQRGIEVEWDSVRMTRSKREVSPARVRLRRRPVADPLGRHVLVLTDVVNTGLSSAFLSRWLLRNGARNVAICAMFDREDARLVAVPLRFRAFRAPNELLAGYGLGLRPQFADLDAVHTLVSMHDVRDSPLIEPDQI
jgi:hypoxanthine phosphoribosyltransferase